MKTVPYLKMPSFPKIATAEDFKMLSETKKVNMDLIYFKPTTPSIMWMKVDSLPANGSEMAWSSFLNRPNVVFLSFSSIPFHLTVQRWLGPGCSYEHLKASVHCMYTVGTFEERWMKLLHERGFIENSRLDEFKLHEFYRIYKSSTHYSNSSDHAFFKPESCYESMCFLRNELKYLLAEF